MSQEAEQTTTEIETTEAGESQTPEVPSVEQPEAKTEGESGPAKADNQSTPMIPKPRFDEVRIRMLQAEAELRMLKQPKQEAQQAQTPDGDPEPKAGDFQTADEYVKALGKWSARQEWAQIRKEESQTKVQEKVKTKVVEAEKNWASQTYEAETKYPDFRQSIESAPELNHAALFILKKSPVAGELAYHLSKNHDLVHKLNELDPIESVAELARIEAKLHGSTGQPKTKPSAQIPTIDPPSGGKNKGTRTGEITQDEVIARLYGKK